MSGFAGCNRVFGPISFSYNRIHIKPLASTKMYCEGTSSIENEIMTILEGNPIYNLKEGHLTLETQKGSLLLKKVD
jgi:heat shock protein HslJ